ncbi:MAG TPA: DUF4837 family protein [Flavobacteriaceae bacterium]|nr:DUF4837 family protein [Flavobacteriaceae bacterium]
MTNKILLCLTLFISIFSCKDKPSERIVSESSGTINNLSLVIDNELWEGSVGDSIRAIFATPVVGLPQDEPLFTISQIPPSVFSGFATKSRIILKIEKGKDADTKLLKDAFAKPQKLALVTGRTDQELIHEINLNANSIINAFKAEEIKERQRQISKSLHSDANIREKLGIALKFPTAYRIAKETDNFFWIRKDITTGTTNLMLYELPLDKIQENDSLINQIISVRDSIGKAHIPGPTDGTYMITDRTYSPFLYETEIAGRKTYEARSLWDVDGAYMSGPFLFYMLKDEPNNRYLIMEGFAFAPSVEKRDYVFEMEAIIKSVKFLDK